MRERPRQRRIKAISKTVVVIGCILILVALIRVGYRFQWTGFQEETLWNWLSVLAIPAVVGLGAAWYTAQQGKVSDRENTDNQRETALQAYIDKMSELLLEKNLRHSAGGDEVRNIAQVRTLAVLRGLDPIRKASVLQFLYQSRLIDRENPIVSLRGADLTGAYLSGVNASATNWPQHNLCGVDLSGAILTKAYLSFTNLEAANLREAVLTEAHMVASSLRGADLSLANLSRGALFGANCSEADLSGANLQGADLRETDLSKADLRYAPVRILDLAKVRHTNLAYARLRGANLAGADLTGANLTGAEGITPEQLAQSKIT